MESLRVPVTEAMYLTIGTRADGPGGGGVGALHRCGLNRQAASVVLRQTDRQADRQTDVRGVEDDDPGSTMQREDKACLWPPVIRAGRFRFPLPCYVSAGLEDAERPMSSGAIQ